MEEDSTKTSAAKGRTLRLRKVNESLAEEGQGEKQRRVSEAPVEDEGFPPAAGPEEGSEDGRFGGVTWNKEMRKCDFHVTSAAEETE